MARFILVNYRSVYILAKIQIKILKQNLNASSDIQQKIWKPILHFILVLLFLEIIEIAIIVLEKVIKILPN